MSKIVNPPPQHNIAFQGAVKKDNSMSLVPVKSGYVSHAAMHAFEGEKLLDGGMGMIALPWQFLAVGLNNEPDGAGNIMNPSVSAFLGGAGWFVTFLPGTLIGAGSIILGAGYKALAAAEAVFGY